MLQIDIPGFGDLALKHIVLDFNGTLATDGIVTDDVHSLLDTLEKQMQVHVLTADTFGTVSSQLKDHAYHIAIVPECNQDLFKADYVKALGGKNVVCIGNGRNDRLMIKEAALSIAVIQNEGASFETLLGAHIICTHIVTALSLLINPKRIVATLRN